MTPRNPLLGPRQFRTAAAALAVMANDSPRSAQKLKRDKDGHLRSCSSVTFESGYFAKGVHAGYLYPVCVSLSFACSDLACADNHASFVCLPC